MTIEWILGAKFIGNGKEEEQRAGTVKTSLKIVAVCFVFGLCLGIGGALAGVAKLVPTETTPPAAPADALLPFAVFCLSVGSVVSYCSSDITLRGAILRCAHTTAERTSRAFMRR
jgi:hypothetical protein